MLLAISEGWNWRYEVCDHADGYLVQMRDLETGDVDEDYSTVFRTLPVAFAYAEMSAAYERHAAGEDEALDGDDAFLELANSERHFVDLSDRLRDSGIHGPLPQSRRGQQASPKPRVLH
jgi:hypothetical protein